MSNQNFWHVRLASLHHEFEADGVKFLISSKGKTFQNRPYNLIVDGTNLSCQSPQNITGFSPFFSRVKLYLIQSSSRDIA